MLRRPEVILGVLTALFSEIVMFIVFLPVILLLFATSRVMRLQIRQRLSSRTGWCTHSVVVLIRLCVVGIGLAAVCLSYIGVLPLLFLVVHVHLLVGWCRSVWERLGRTCDKVGQARFMATSTVNNVIRRRRAPGVPWERSGRGDKGEASEEESKE